MEEQLVGEFGAGAPDRPADARALACRATRTVAKAGAYAISCRLTARARALGARGSVRLTVVTTFTPANGRPVTTRSTATLARGR